MIKKYTVADDVVAFSTTRKGGVSTGNYGEFNINEYCGDEPANIAENKRRLAAELGLHDGEDILGVERIVMPHQVHGVEVRQIAPEFLTLPLHVRKMILEGVDAVITSVKEICIGVSTADCIPVLLYDEVHQAVAAIHAGWRGTLERIVHKTIMEMKNAFGTNPHELKAVIGPGISLEHFEVGDEVYEAFEQAAFDMASIAEQRPNAAFTCATQEERERLASEGNVVQPMKWHINLPLCNEQILRHVGVKEENIFQSGICTFAHSDEYFSARKLGTESGRIYTGIMLK